MEQGQDLGCAAADGFVRVLGRVVARLPGWARMRHGLKRPRLVLTPDREPKLRPQRVGLLDQLFLAKASGSLTRTTPYKAVLALAHRDAGFAPRAAFLPAQASFVQGAPDRIGADPRQPVIGLPQGSLQQAHGPGGRAVLVALGRAHPFG